MTCRIIDAHTHIGRQGFIVRAIPEEKLKKPAFKDPLENTYESLLGIMGAESALEQQY